MRVTNSPSREFGALRDVDSRGNEREIARGKSASPGRKFPLEEILARSSRSRRTRRSVRKVVDTPGGRSSTSVSSKERSSK